MVRAKRESLRVGIDTGGTFTDVAVVDGGSLRVHKVPSTPHDPGVAVRRGVEDVRDERPVDLVHGTTVGLNAILTGNTARVAFVTNEGFEDLIEIGRQDRSDLYDLTAPKPVIPVARDLRFGIPSRRDAAGKLLLRPSDADLDRLRRRVARAKPDAIAIGLLHSYHRVADERAIARALRPLGLPMTCSAELLPTPGEFERFCTAILNAGIQPIMGDYLARLGKSLARTTLRLMRSSGGIMASREAHHFPARAVFSGPAGGVFATRQLAAELDLGTVAALDMGGTSSDVTLVTPHANPTTNRTMAGLPLATPAVEVHTIGCGGGSIARVDRGGALRVGPESAGAFPGPACYGHGDEATVTDAHMVLGHLGPETLLDGEFPVDPDLSVRAVEKLARKLGSTLRDAALGILEIADVAMMRALLVITAERAVDPSSVPLVTFGGAGGLHAASLMRRLSMPRAIVPPAPGAWSAVGLSIASEAFELSEPVLRPVESISSRDLKQLGDELAQRATKLSGLKARARIEARVRFQGQGQGLWVPLRASLQTSFHRAHSEQFGFLPDHATSELVEVRARLENPIRKLPNVVSTHTQSSVLRKRKPLSGGAALRVWKRDELSPRRAIQGPCVIEETTGATFVPAGMSCRLKGASLHLTIG